MASLMNMLKGFFQTIGSVIDFIVDFFADLVYVITLLGKFVLEIPMYFSWLPGELIALVATLFSLVIIYMILGRK